MRYIAPNAEQLVELLTDIIRRHNGHRALHEPVLIDIDDVRVSIDFVELSDITDECQRSGCCDDGQDGPDEDATKEGVHFAVVIGGYVP
ncbi:hypothetical protein ACN27G_29160 [Plantactinospora sp. WMMB334]|uniref:hypothetical protein n=1 Tax=Plantactinospora sp. WMMB334 TaxID=3404119 RepID=UPI003B965B45